MTTSLKTIKKNICFEFFESHRQLLEEIVSKEDVCIAEAVDLAILLSFKYMPKSKSSMFVINENDKALFGFNCVYQPESLLKHKDVQIALDKAREEIAKYTISISAQTFIALVREAISESAKYTTTLSPLNLVHRVLKKLNDAPFDAFDTGDIIDVIEPEDEFDGLSNAHVDESHHASISRRPKNFYQKFYPKRLLTSDFISTREPVLKDLLNQSCYVVCASSIENGILTNTLGSTADSKQLVHKKIVSLKPQTFLAAIKGSPVVVDLLAKAFGVMPVEVQFPQHIHELRSELMEHISTKTFELYENGKRQETNWLKKAEEKKKLLTASSEIEYFLGLITLIQASAITFEELQSYSSSENWQYIGEELGKFIQMNIVGKKSRIQKLSLVQSVKYGLNSQVLGQPEAVDSMTTVVSNMLFKAHKTHLGVSTFLGPTGVGKTFMAEKFSEILNKKLELGYQCKVLNMEQYTIKDDVMKLWGAGTQYVNSEFGELTSAVFKNPYQIIVLDELEKAHPVVIQSLLTLIDKGYAIDRTTERLVDFSRCIFIVTTNQGAKSLDKLSHLDMEIDVRDLLTQSTDQNALSSEMVSRLAAGNIVLFKKLSTAKLVQLASKISDNFLKESAIDWRDNVLPRLMLETLGGDITPRNLKTQAEKLEGAILSKAMNSIEEQDFEKLENICVNSEFEPSVADTNIVLFSNNERLCDFMRNHGVKCHPAKSITLMREVMEIGADCFVFDDKSLEVEANELLAMFGEFSKTICYLMTGISDSPIESLNKSQQVFQREFTAETRTKTLLLQELRTMVSDVRTIKNSSEHINRKLKANYSIDISMSDNGVAVMFKDFSFKPAISQTDLLPFLSFDAAPDVSFNDVLGLEGAKQDLKLVVNAMKKPEYLAKYNTSLPKGSILAGCPGTGKTMLAKALAAECGVPFFNVNSADLLGGHVVENINALFDILEKHAPAIVFFDEIDAIAQCRSKGSDIIRAAVNTLLVRLDGFKTVEQPIFVVAATNHPKLLDPALLRSGRLEKHVYCDLPNWENRRLFIESELGKANRNINKEQFAEITQMTAGASIALLDQFIRESFQTAIKTDKEWTVAMLVEEIRSVKFGSIRTDLVQASEDINATAYHEAAHLVAHKLLFPSVKVELASVQPRGAALGMIVPGDSGYAGKTNKQHIKNSLQVLLAGLATERMQGYVGDNSLSGASDDRQKATNLAKRAIVDWGMSEKFGLAIPSQLSISATDIAAEVNQWLLEAFDSVTKLIEDNQELLNKVTQELIERETLNALEIDELFSMPISCEKIKLAG